MAKPTEKFSTKTRLPPRPMFATVNPSAVAAGIGVSADPPKASPEKINIAKQALDKPKRGKGPPKGAGGRPKKAEPVSKRTEFRRKKSGTK